MFYRDCTKLVNAVRGDGDLDLPSGVDLGPSQTVGKSGKDSGEDWVEGGGLGGGDGGAKKSERGAGDWLGAFNVAVKGGEDFGEDVLKGSTGGSIIIVPTTCVLGGGEGDLGLGRIGLQIACCGWGFFLWCWGLSGSCCFKQTLFADWIP